MYSIMVVDDDAIVRTTIKCIIDWRKHGYEIISEAGNGKQALKRMQEQKVDILITDINMPVMNGLELIKEVLRFESPPQILALSAYSDYNLVREAFKLGVQDYVLKSEITSKNLLENVRILSDRLGGYALTSGRSANTESLSQTLRALARNTPVKDDSALYQRMRNGYCLVYFEVEDYKHISLRFGSGIEASFVAPMCDIAVAAVEQDCCVFTSLSPKEYLLLVTGEVSAGETLLNHAQAWTQLITAEWKKYLNIGVTASISSVGKDASAFCGLLRQAREDLEARCIFGKYHIFMPEDKGKFDVSLANSSEKAYAPLIDSLFSGKEQLKKELAAVMEKLKPLSSPRQIQECLYIIHNVVRLLWAAGDEIETVFGKEIDFYQKLTLLKTQDDREIWLLNFLSWIADYIEHHHARKESNLVKKATGFIGENFADENICLKLVADYVGLSEKYFSTVFAQQTGETFTDYLMRIRIERAKKLFMTTNMKVYEIAGSVGYSSVEHFSRSFKKQTGISPSDYKK